MTITIVYSAGDGLHGCLYEAKLPKTEIRSKKPKNKDMSQMFLSRVSSFPMTHRSQENYSSWNVRMQIRPNETTPPPPFTA